MKKYSLGQTFDLQSYMEALNNEYEKRQKYNSLRTIALIYAIIASYSFFFKGLVELSKHLLLIITYIIATLIKIGTWIRRKLKN